MSSEKAKIDIHWFIRQPNHILALFPEKFWDNRKEKKRVLKEQSNFLSLGDQMCQQKKVMINEKSTSSEIQALVT